MKRLGRYAWMIEAALFIYWLAGYGPYTRVDICIYIVSLYMMARRLVQVFGKRGVR